MSALGGGRGLPYRQRVRPLHLVLKARFFDEFASGRKTIEWRRHGRRYNQTTIPDGRAITLRRGYTATCLAGHVVEAHIVASEDAPPEVRAIFGCREGALEIVAIEVSLKEAK
jgi:hypothetical protein